MAKERVSERMQAQIRVLISQGCSIRKISESLGISRQTVRRYMHGKPVPTLEEVKTIGAVPASLSGWDVVVNWTAILEAAKSGVTVKQLHREHAPERSYWSFWRQLNNRIGREAPSIVLRIEHKPGERVEIDYADGIDLIDRRTGEVQRTQLFCGVLPFSSYTFGEFTMSQKLPSFIASQERMWRFFGGVTPYVVIDNLKAGVSRAHRYDPDVNPTYCDYSNHVGFAVLPARPYKPRDKASIEAAIGAIQRGFYQEVREKQFYSLAELNAAFLLYLERFNAGVMKDHGKSRNERFATEKPLLKALPRELFEISEWKHCKVHPDCHIQVERNFYSVPYNLVGQAVRVRVGQRIVEVFSSDNEPMAAHPRQSGVGKFSTQEEHYPDKKLGIKRFEVKAAQKQAERVGPHTTALIESLISVDYPLRHLRRIQGILRLFESKHVTAEALEYACSQALVFKKPRFAYIKSCAEHFSVNGHRLALVVPNRNTDDMYLHGDDDRISAVRGAS